MGEQVQHIGDANSHPSNAGPSPTLFGIYRNAIESGETHTYRTPIRSGEVETRWYLQPRLGISHPISEQAAMHYSWGKFYSPPSFSYLYEDYDSFTNPAWPNVPDVEADPTTATAYEMGL